MIRFMRSKLFLALVVIAILAVGAGVGRLILQNRAMAQEVAALEAESESQGARNAEFLELVKRFQTDSFLEREARLKLNLQKPGEKAIGVRRVESAATSTASSEDGDRGGPDNLARWRDYFFAPDRLDGDI